MKTKLIYRTKGRAREYAPYALDMYTGCDFGCKYCFNDGSIASVKMRDNIKQDILREDLSKLAQLRENGASNEDIRVLTSFSSDPYNKLERINDRMEICFKLFNEFNIPFTVLTKSGLYATKDFELYNKELGEFAVTLAVPDEKCKEWEPNAALTSDRIASLKVAKEMGIKTWVSLEPVINPEWTLKLIEMSHGYVDKFKVGKINHNPDIESKIDWVDFREKAVALLTKLGKDYYIKKDLREWE